MEASLSGRAPADRSASSCPDWQRLGPDDEPLERPPGLDSVTTLRVGHPLRLVEAVVMQQKVLALIARRPGVIVLDVAGILPMDDMGVLMLPSVALDAAEAGVAVAVANPSPPLRDRLAQLGVRNLTFIDRPVPTTAPTEDGHETVGLPAALPPTGSEEPTRLTGSGPLPAHAVAGMLEEGLPISASPLHTS
jgi:anti-anti-sigma regulatory factor